MTLISRRLLFVMATVISISWGSVTAAPIDTDDPLILAVHVDGKILTRDLLAFPHSNGIVVPLQQLSQVIGFAIAATPNEGRAYGFFLGEERIFELDMHNETVTVQGVPAYFDPHLTAIEMDDIYVDLDLLARWFPLSFDFDPQLLRLTVEPHELLPFQRRLERETRARWLAQVQDRASPSTSLKPLSVQSPSPIVSRPFSSHHLTFEFHRGAENLQGVKRSYATDLVGTVLDLDASVSLRIKKDNPVLQHVLFSRESPEPNLLGPLRARHFAIGDVNLSNLPHLPSITTGRGITISSHPRYRPWQYSTHTFEGEIPPNWDAELYQNDVLVAYHGTHDGRFYTLEAPLYYGLNQFKLVMYGPLGQRRVRMEDKYIDHSIMPPNQSAYRLAAVQSDKGTVLWATYDQGVGLGLSLHGVLTNLPMQDQKRGLTFQLGFNQSLGNVHLEAHALVDESGKYLRDARLDWVRSSSRLTFQRTLAPSNDPFQGESLFTERTRLQGHASLGRVQLRGTPVILAGEFEAKRESYEATPTLYDASSTLWAHWRHWLISHRVTGSIRHNEDTDALGRLSVYRLFDNAMWRAHVEYDLMSAAVRELGTVYTWKTTGSSEHTLRTLLRPDEKEESKITFGTRRHFGNVSISAHATYNWARTWNLGFSVSFGTAPHPRGWQRQVTRPSSIDTGAVFVEAFHKAPSGANAAIKRQPMEGLSFYVNNRLHPVRTDPHGNLWITNLPIHEYVEIRVDQRTVPDPFLKPAHERIQVVPRPGHNLRVDYPFVMTSEIDGTVYVLEGDSHRIAAGIRLHLIDERGHILHETISEYDGFYIIAAVPPGTYTLRPAPDQIARLGLQSESVIVDVPADGSWVSDIDMILVQSR